MTYRFASILGNGCSCRAADEVDARAVEVNVFSRACAVVDVLIFVLEEKDKLDNTNGQCKEPDRPKHRRVEAHGAVRSKDGANEAKERSEAEQCHLARQGTGEDALDRRETVELMDECPDERAGDDQRASKSDGGENQDAEACRKAAAECTHISMGFFGKSVCLLDSLRW